MVRIPGAKGEGLMKCMGGIVWDRVAECGVVGGGVRGGVGGGVGWEVP